MLEIKRGLMEFQFFKNRSKKGQVWIETVIYTLIALTLIGLLLAFAKPKIDSIRDQLIIEQTIESLNKINDQIVSVQISPGNKRTLSLKISKGSFIINSSNDSIGYVLESKYKYSEIGRLVNVGSLVILTEEASPYRVSIRTNHPVNITLSGSEDYKEFESAPAPYQVVIENKGINVTSRVNVDFEVN